MNTRGRDADRAVEGVTRSVLRRGARVAPALAMLVVTAAASHSVVHACTCVDKPPVCYAYWDASAVFTGEVIGISNDDESASKVTTPMGSVIRFRIEKAYRGIEPTKVEATVHTDRTPAECGYPFALRERYLVYAYQGTNQLYTSSCARTQRLAEARADLAFIERASRGDLTATLSGSVMRYARDYWGRLVFVDQPQGTALELAGGTHRFEAATAGEGRFVFPHVPPGRYRLRPRSLVTPVNACAIRIVLRSGECASLDVHVTER